MDARANERARVGIFALGVLGIATLAALVASCASTEMTSTWSGVSKTFDPTSSQAFITDVSKTVAKSLEKERLVL